MLDIYLKIFNLWDLNKTNSNEYKDLIKEFEKFGLEKTNINLNKKITVCGNFIIDTINTLFKTNIPIIRSFENYKDYLKLLTEEQKEELEKIELELNLSKTEKEKIYGVFILKEILQKYPFNELNEVKPNSIIIYYDNSSGKELPEHLGFLLNNGMVISKLGVINEIYLHPIDKIPSKWGNKFKLFYFGDSYQEFSKGIEEYFK